MSSGVSAVNGGGFARRLWPATVQSISSVRLAITDGHLTSKTQKKKKPLNLFVAQHNNMQIVFVCIFFFFLLKYFLFIIIKFVQSDFKTITTSFYIYFNGIMQSI